MKGLVIEVNAQKGNAVCGLRSRQALTQKMLFSFVIRNVAASPVRTPDHHAHPIPLLGVVHTSPQTTSSLCICPILRLVLLTFGDPSLLPISKISLGGVRKYESIGPLSVTLYVIRLHSEAHWAVGHAPSVVPSG